MSEVATAPTYAFRPSPAERAHLEDTHHEVCTASTVVMTNVELLRRELIQLGLPSAGTIVQASLTDLDSVAARLHQLSKTLRIWHGDTATVLAVVPDRHDDLIGADDAGERERDPLRVTARIRATAAQLGFPAPPGSLDAKLIQGKLGWTLFLRPRPETPAAALVAWIEKWGPIHVGFDARRLFRADFRPVPPAWKARYEHVDLGLMKVSPDGTAEASVSGTRAAIASFAQLISLPEEGAEICSVKAMPSPARLLTPAQDEAIRAAAKAGYYQIPRPLNLRQLADRLRVSSASLSERLRRAEARVIMQFINEDGLTSWPEVPIDAAASAEPWTEWSAVGQDRKDPQVVATLSDEDVIDLLARAPRHTVEHDLLLAEARFRLSAVRRGIYDTAQGLEADLLAVQAIVARSVAESAEKDVDRESYDIRNIARESALEHIQATQAMAALERASRNLVQLRGAVNSRSRTPEARAPSS